MGLFLTSGVLAAVRLAAAPGSGPGWFGALAAMLALPASIAGFARVLPWTNLLLAGGSVAFAGVMLQAVSAATGLPFGQVSFAPNAGPALLGLVPWWLPVLGVANALTSRGTARLILFRSRRHPFHGYRVIAVASLLAGACALGIEVFARKAHLQSGGVPVAIHGLVSLLIQLLIQIAVTPLLIDKFPGARPPDFRPLVVWGGLNGMLAAGIVLV